MQVTESTAKAKLPKLIDAALAGEEVVIARRDRPAVKLVPVPQRKFRIGLLADRLDGPVPDFFEPLNDRDLAAWGDG
ncbi:type II toxin-antitoxin system prevent-host-death family antitoxin [Inquilinus limosus]|uniref:type II toxin-antitoxin system Phd/YefM family antitoxin n=1 Tax=Inquilinus limosus TaxID=171674 RepID=UPI003F15EBED